MRTSLVLREWERREIELDPPTVEALGLEFSHALELLPRGGGRYRVRALSRVGSIVVPDLEIRIRPKCGLRNLFWMLAWTHGLAEHYPELVAIEEVDDIREFLLSILTDQVELLVRRGLRRGYIEEAGDSPMLRGRLDFDRHMRRAHTARLSLPCRYEEYTADLPFNQVIGHTLRRVGTSEHPPLAARLRRLRVAFAHLGTRHFVSSDFDRFEYDRLTEHYRSIHALCRILLDARGGEDVHGELSVGSLLVDMNLVFERFVAAWLAANLPDPWRVTTQAGRSLDVGGKLSIIPDLLLTRGAELQVVADTKYKAGSRGTPENTDAYQALAYCRALGVRSCVLIYPDHVPRLRFVVTDGKNEILTKGVTLDGSVPEIEASMQRLCDGLIDLGSKQPLASVS